MVVKKSRGSDDMRRGDGDGATKAMNGGEVFSIFISFFNKISVRCING